MCVGIHVGNVPNTNNKYQQTYENKEVKVCTIERYATLPISLKIFWSERKTTLPMRFMLISFFIEIVDWPILVT